MAIFNSYVKLPEGNTHTRHIRKNQVYGIPQKQMNPGDMPRLFGKLYPNKNTPYL